MTANVETATRNDINTVYLWENGLRVPTVCPKCGEPIVERFTRGRGISIRCECPGKRANWGFADGKTLDGVYRRAASVLRYIRHTPYKV